MKTSIALFTAALLVAPASAKISESHRGTATLQNGAIACVSFSEWLDVVEAAWAGSAELVAHHLSKKGTSCVISSIDKEVIVTDQSAKWAEIQVKTATGFVKAYSHRVYLNPVGDKL